ncbi:MAG: 3-deoxy-7-phosphoheptulonate synthase [Planctomycetes bacterium]|nr:3-deoxy-7-phosphoheptulonate synthase [Planctomycetota bacterium]
MDESCDLSGWKISHPARPGAPEGRDVPEVRPVPIGPIAVGGGRPVVIAGPCAVESRAQTLEIAEAVREAGGDMLRGGAFKPRTSPYSFQGLGEKGLEILAEVRERTGLPIVTEVMDPRLVGLVSRYADVLQVGSRNMQNFPLLVEVGRSGKPVLLKRGWSATVEEWLGAAEYIAAEGNLRILLCERGIRTFASRDGCRNTLDLTVIGLLRRRTFLPVLVDPSHATGDAALVPAASRAALAAGADGLIIEVIGATTDRAEIHCDGRQGIRPAVLRELVAAARATPRDCRGVTR